MEYQVRNNTHKHTQYQVTKQFENWHCKVKQIDSQCS